MGTAGVEPPLGKVAGRAGTKRPPVMPGEASGGVEFRLRTKIQSLLDYIQQVTTAKWRMT